MPGSNRASLIAKMYKVLKQHYKQTSTPDKRPLLEQMLFACCLENTPYEKADKVYTHLHTSFFDWNEVRVSTVKELAEAMRELPDPAAAASNLKSVLQNAFEATYSFDLESVKKQNLGVAIKRLAKMEGASPFVVAYVTQHALGGHSIPLDRGSLEVLYIVGVSTEDERRSGNVAGLERAIPKNKGADFGAVLHQLAADLVANPFSPTVKSVLLAINPDAKDRLPKRGQKRSILQPPVVPEAQLPASKSAANKVAMKAATEPGRTEKSLRETSRPNDKKSNQKSDPKDAKKSVAGKPSPSEAAKKPVQKKPSAARTVSGHKSRALKQLAKRKPR